MLQVIKNFIRGERGFAAGEFALWLPALLLIILGCFEATRYILIHQKLDRAASQVADLVGQSDGMTTAQLTAVYDAAIEQMMPYDLDTQGQIIVSSVFRLTGETDPKVAWQRRMVQRSAAARLAPKGPQRICPTTLLSRNPRTSSRRKFSMRTSRFSSARLPG